MNKYCVIQYTDVNGKYVCITRDKISENSAIILINKNEFISFLRNNDLCIMSIMLIMLIMIVILGILLCIKPLKKNNSN